MKTKKVFLILICLLGTTVLFAQNDKVRQLISEGVRLHDQGQYQGAIAKYKEALSIDKESSLAYYELAYSYLNKGDFDDAIDACRKGIKLKSNQQEQFYVLLGTAYDYKNQPEKAIKAYEEGIAEFPNSNSLNFNLGVTLFNTGNYKRAAEVAIVAIKANPKHASSHILLSNAMFSLNERAKGILALYYALILEPEGKRAIKNLETLKKELGFGVKKSGENTINLTLNMSGDLSNQDKFKKAELPISLAAALRHTEEYKSISDAQYFAENNKKVIQFIEKTENSTDFWDVMYLNKFKDMVDTENWEAFSYHISKSNTSDADIKKWIKENEPKMIKFKNWMETKK